MPSPSESSIERKIHARPACPTTVTRWLSCIALLLFIQIGIFIIMMWQMIRTFNAVNHMIIDNDETIRAILFNTRHLTSDPVSVFFPAKASSAAT